MKSTKVSGRGQLYSITSKGVKANEKGELGTQATLVFKAVEKSQPANSAKITEIVENGKLETNQAVSRVVGFYLTQFKAEGYVSSKAAPKAEKKATKKAPEKARKAKKSTPAPAEVAA